jgi:hypothetical protein
VVGHDAAVPIIGIIVPHRPPSQQCVGGIFVRGLFFLHTQAKSTFRPLYIYRVEKYALTAFA